MQFAYGLISNGFASSNEAEVYDINDSHSTDILSDLKSSVGLSVGLNICGKTWNDATLLEFAQEYKIIMDIDNPVN